MAVKQVALLDTKDGFTSSQISSINRALTSERNRWMRRSKQKILSPKFEDGLVSASGLVSTRQTYSYNGIVSFQFYLNVDLLPKDTPVELLRFKKNIKSFHLIGNAYEPGTEAGDIAKLVVFYVQENKLYAFLRDELNFTDVNIYHIDLEVVVSE